MFGNLTHLQSERKMGVGSLYRSMRDLPATLKYDYNRRVIARETKKSVPLSVERKLLAEDVTTSVSTTDSTPSPAENSYISVENIRLLIGEMEALRKDTQAMLLGLDSELRGEKQLQVPHLRSSSPPFHFSRPLGGPPRIELFGQFENKNWGAPLDAGESRELLGFSV